MLDTREILKVNVNALLAKLTGSRIAKARLLDVGDGSLGRIVYANGNTTLDVLLKIAGHFKLEPWQLLAPNLGKAILQQAAPEVDIDTLLKLSTPRSKNALDTIIQAAQEGRLQEEDLELLNAIAARFMTKG